MLYKELFQNLFFFFSNERQREHQQKLSAIKKPLKNSQWFFSFLSLLALNYLLNDLAWFFFSFPTNDTLQWHEDLIFERVKSAWHIYNKQLASQSTAKPATEFLRRRWQVNPPGSCLPPSPSLYQATRNSTHPCSCWFTFLLSFLLDRASFGNGSWNLHTDAIV